jgi:ABC-2 type transport system ATP-binding protein
MRWRRTASPCWSPPITWTRPSAATRSLTSNGKLLARGTAEEVVEASQLKAWIATGPGADRLAPLLRDAPGVTAAAAFGATLHVCGPDAAALEKAIAPYRQDRHLAWRKARATLEDVFIHLMGQARDNAEAA